MIEPNRTTYLVTGGAGFIGSALVRLLLAAHPEACVVTVDALTYAGSLENLRASRDFETAMASGAAPVPPAAGPHGFEDLGGAAASCTPAPLDNPRHAFVQADIRDRAAMAEVFETYRPAFVLNLAAESHVDRSISVPTAFEDTNVGGTVALLDVVRAAWERPDGSYPPGVRFLQVSTDEVYGSLPLRAGSAAFREDTPLGPRSPYAASKASADLFVRAYHETYGFPALITRCSNNYGARQHPEKLIPHAIGCCLRHERVPLYGDGLNVRDWIFVGDHCRALDDVLARGRVGEVYNVGARCERPNAELVRRVIAEVAAVTGDAAITDGLIRHVPDRRGHDRRYAIDPGKLERELGWRPRASFDAALSETVRWYLTHPAVLGV